MAEEDRQREEILRKLYGLGGLTYGYMPPMPQPAPTRPSEYASALLGFVPGVGDTIGLAADAKMYMQRPEERTLGNLGLSMAGLLPLVPALSAAKTAERFDPDFLIGPQKRIEKVNRTDKAKVAKIAASMAESGWKGRPLVVFNSSSSGLQALTGSHRIDAAKQVGVDIPVVEVDPRVYDHVDEYGNTIEDVWGSGDDRVAKFLEDAGDVRASELLRMEPYN